MDVDFLLFPKRNPSYGVKMMGKELIWIPKFQKNKQNLKNQSGKVFAEEIRKPKPQEQEALKTNKDSLFIQTEDAKTNAGSVLEPKSLSGSMLNSPINGRLDLKKVTTSKEINRGWAEQSQQMNKGKSDEPSHEWYKDMLNIISSPSSKNTASNISSPQHKYFPVKGCERSGSENRFNKTARETSQNKIIEKRRKSKIISSEYEEISRDICNSRELNELGSSNDEITNFKDHMKKYVTQPLKKMICFPQKNINEYRVPDCFYKKQKNGSKGPVIIERRAPLKEWWVHPQQSSEKNRKLEEEAIYSINYNQEVISRVPCLLLEPEKPSGKILVYFHGNGEDLNLSYTFLDYLRNYFKMRVLAIEYPGYGVYINHASTAKKVLEDAEDIYEYLIKIIGYKERDILLLGRSIGGGPAIHLAAQNSPACLGLISTFSSVKELVKDHVGALLPYLIQERFANSERIRSVRSPTFILHGKMDTLIPFSHSQKLAENCFSKHELHLADDMTHGCFDFRVDFAEPFKNFIATFAVNPDIQSQKTPPKFPIDVYQFSKDSK